MSLAVFDEAFYLESYPDVQAAVKTGFFQSGLQHFQQFGLAEGRVQVSPFYDEEFYLQKYGDVAAAVSSGFFRTGLQHFIQLGETEGRQASELFDEDFYLRKNPDVAAAVAAGSFSSGLAHYLQFGQDESRSGTNFNEFGYFIKGVKVPHLPENADVAAAIADGVFESGLEHYIKFGQFEGRGAIFSGTKGNDTVTAFGQLDTLYGVDLSSGPAYNAVGTPIGGQALDYFSSGVNEADVLIGGAGKDTFVLYAPPFPGRIVGPSFVLYQGGGNADFARIENFEIGKDEIVLAGAASNYDFVQSGDSLNILFSRGDFSGPRPAPDLVATVEGVTSLSQIESSLRFIGTVF